MTTFVIDVSRHNYDRGEINWSSVRSENIEIATTLASEGDPAGYHFYSSTFLHVIGMARQAGIRLIGGRHILNAGDQRCINRQVDMLLERAKTSGGLEKGWWMVDVEPTQKLCSTTPRYSDLMAFQDRWFEATNGYPLVVHVPYWVWERMGSPSLHELKTIIASSDLPPIVHLPFMEMYSGDEGYDWISFHGRPEVLHHFCSTGMIHGISGTCDVSAFRGTVEQFVSLVTTRMGEASCHNF